MKDNANFAQLGELEFTGTPALYEFCDVGRVCAGNSNLIIATSMHDLHRALLTIPSLGRTPASVRARLVVRHGQRAAEHLHAAQVSFAKLPKAFVKHYGDAMQAHRQRKVFDLKGA